MQSLERVGLGVAGVGVLLFLAVQILNRVLSVDTGANIGLGLIGIASYVVVALGALTFIVGFIMRCAHKE